jgi:hypothetical protein
MTADDGFQVGEWEQALGFLQNDLGIKYRPRVEKYAKAILDEQIGIALQMLMSGF